jgi:hypothetical protein
MSGSSANEVAFTPGKSGDVKGTIRSDAPFLFASNDVRRHRLISISYISLLPCHSSILFANLPNPLVCIASWKASLDHRSAQSTRFQNVLKRCAPALRHSAIIFCTRTQGRCNQHDMGEGILG